MSIFNHGLPPRVNVIQGEGGTDTSKDTVTADAMREGYTAHDAAGQPITGTIPNYDGAITEGAVEGAQAKYEEGVAAGKKSEYDAFWDAFQDYGNRTNYNMAFAGGSWTPEMLKPKYPIHPNDGGREYSYEGARIFERFGKKSLDKGSVYDWNEITANMDIDFSSVSHPISLFANANITNLDVDLSGAVSMYQTFAHSDCGCVSSHDPISIRFKVTEKCVSFSNTFSYSTILAELILTDDSTIAANGFNVQWSTLLSHDSLMSIINALKDYSEDTSGTEWIVTLGSENIAKLTADELYIAEAKGWRVA
jgi:hypothetical protein